MNTNQMNDDQYAQMGRVGQQPISEAYYRKQEFEKHYRDSKLVQDVMEAMSSKLSRYVAALDEVSKVLEKVSQLDDYQWLDTELQNKVKDIIAKIKELREEK